MYRAEFICPPNSIIDPPFESIGNLKDCSKKNLFTIPLVNGTIPHEQVGKYSGSLVFMRPASQGTGVIAGGAMRAIMESVGIKDILAKSKGSSNPHNVVKATMDALLQLRDAKFIAKQRGITLSKVFNSK